MELIAGNTPTPAAAPAPAPSPPSGVCTQQCHLPPPLLTVLLDEAGTSCSSALNLATLTSPYSGTTASGMDSLSSCGNGKEVVFYASMPPGAQITIGQTSNGFDSKHESRYGGSCPGATSIRCTDEPDMSGTTPTPTPGTRSLQHAIPVWHIAAWSAPLMHGVLPVLLAHAH